MNPISRGDVWCPWQIVTWNSYPSSKPKVEQEYIVRGTEKVGKANFLNGEWVNSSIPVSEIIGWRVK